MRLAACLAVALLAAGCSAPAPTQPLPDEWRGRDLREPGWANETLQPGWTLALQYEWSSGTRVAWDWVVTAPVQQRDPLFTAFVHFQLVRMDDDRARALVAHDAQEGQGERTIGQGGAHEMDWMNEWSQPVTIAHHAPAGSTRVLYPPGQGPGCIFQPGAKTVANGACLLVPQRPPGVR